MKKRLLALGFLFVIAIAHQASADPSRLINYQGRLVDGNGVPLADGSYDMTFKIYDALSGGTLLWTEAHTGGSAVTVTNGLFSVVLGPTSMPDFNSTPYYIEITVGATVYSPRKQLTGAITAVNADLLDGQHGTYYQRRVGSTCGVGSSIRIINADGTVTCQTDVGSAGHGSLSGLGNDDHPQYFALAQDEIVTGRPAFNGGTTGSNSPFDVDSTYLVANLNSDLLDGYQAGNASGNVPVSNGTVNTNLNADMIDGYHYTSFILDGCTDCLNATEIEDIYVLNTSDTMSGTLGVTGAITGSSTVQGTQFISTIVTGTAPLTVASTTKVTNLNVDRLDNYHAGNASGNVPVSNGTVNTNLNADMLDGYHYTSFILDGCTDCLNATEIEDIYVLNTSDTMSGSLGVGTTLSVGTSATVGTTLGVTGAITGASTVQGTQLISTIVTGTAPLTVASTTNVTNLSADMLDGYHYTSFILDGCADCLNATEIEDIYVLNTSDTMSGSLGVGTTLSVGTSATVGTTLGVTGAITGASTVQGTRLISTIVTGTAPLTVASTTNVTNLNADLLDGYTTGNASGNIPLSNGTVNTNLNADMLDGYHSTSFILDGCADCLNATEIEDIYVFNTGDTMTGALNISMTTGPGLSVTNNSASAHVASFIGGPDDTAYEWVGFYSGASRLGIFLWDGAWNECLANEFCITGEVGALALDSNGTIYMRDPVDHENQGIVDIDWASSDDGSGSGLDADLLDGYHFSDLENRYVNITGDTMTGDLNMNGSQVVTNAARFETTGVSSYDKLRVWNSGSYAIGMTSGNTYGGIANEYAMTFTMDTTANRGFLWRDSADAATDAAMSLTTDGRLTVKSGITAYNNIYVNSPNYGQGLVGTYNASRARLVYSMGAAYMLGADGTTAGNLYGIAFTHTNWGLQSKTGLGHQMMVMANGVTQTAIGTGIWTNGVITSTYNSGAPLAVTSTTVNTNFNSDMVDGMHYTDLACSILYFSVGAWPSGGTTNCPAGKAVVGTMDTSRSLRNPDFTLGTSPSSGYMLCCPTNTPFP